VVSLRWLISVAMVVGLSGTAFALERVDGIVAVVGDSVILQSELDAYTLMRMNALGTKPDSVDMDALRKKFLDELIDGKVFLVHAQKDSTIGVKDQEIDEELDRQIKAILKENALTPEQLEAELQKQNNMTLAQFKAQMRKGIFEQRLKQKVIQRNQSSARMARRDVESFYAQYKDSLPDAGKSVRLAKLSMNVAPSDSVKQVAYERIRKIKERLAGGEDFVALAKQFSDDPNAESGGDLGFIAKGTLGELTFEEKAFSVQPGRNSDVFETRLGFHIIRVDEKKDQRAHVRQILVLVQPSEAQRAAVFARLDSVRTHCTTKASFADAVKRLSSDNQSRGRGGDMGWLSVYALSSGVASAVDTLAPGAISEPVEQDNVYSVYRVQDRAENRKYTLQDDWDELASKARDIYAQKRLFDLVRKWRDEEFVDVRL